MEKKEWRVYYIDNLEWGDYRDGSTTIEAETLEEAWDIALNDTVFQDLTIKEIIPEEELY